MIFKNKKAGEEILSIWLFLVFAVILVGIVAGILIFYSVKADVRQSEAEILNFKIEDCLKKAESFSSFDIFKECKIDKKIIENSGRYYVKITLNENVFDYGVRNFETLCSLQDKSEDFPRCYENSFNIEKDKRYKIKILTASNNAGGKI